MVGSQRAMVKREASRRGWRAAFAGVISAGAIGASVGIGAPLLITLGVTVAGVSYTGMKLSQWLRYRGEHGLRF
jgi:hypothetical protein